jgi:hypothetical protein
MNLLQLARYVIGVGAAAALAACAGGAGLNPAAPQSNGYVSAPEDRPNPPRSWMRRDAKSHDLLYVGDTYTNDVFVYEYPSLTLAGTLTGFEEPGGMCVDESGDVFITNSGNGTAVEYAHGGSQALQTFHTGYESYPIGCAVSPGGDLAISDYRTDAGFGAILIYKHATGTPTFYASDYCYEMNPGGYDDRNNLWFQGSAAAKGGGICELPAGGSSIVPVSFNQTIDVAGSTMWDGKYITLTDQGDAGSDSKVYRATASGSVLTAVGTPTVLTDECVFGESDVAIPFIAGTRNTPANHKEGTVVVGTDYICLEYGTPNVEFWSYPAGGDPDSTMTNPPKDPAYEAISIHAK